MRARSFLFVSLGVLALALAYHFGASTATAQTGGTIVGVAPVAAQNGNFIVLTSNGDVFQGPIYMGVVTPFQHIGNIWSGAPTPAQRESMGQLKARYR